MTDTPPRVLQKQIELTADLSNWDELMQFLQEQIDSSVSETSKAYKLLLAAEELLSNMIREASKAAEALGRQPTVMLSSWIVIHDGQQQFDLELSDDGLPFDPHFEDILDEVANQPISERPIGGLGLFLVKRSVDKVNYTHTDGRNIYRLTTLLSA
jgi:anti-sigma regulatory factor (Ser/Thr protein kinase)